MLSATASAGLWSGLLQWSKVGINAVVFILLARWLTLAEIGAVAASQAVFIFVQSLQSAVVPDLMVQEDEERDDHRSTLFLASIGAGAVVSVGVLAAVTIVPALGFHTVTGRYLAALSPLPIIWGAGAFYEGLLRRRLDMRSLAVRTLVASSAAGIVAVALAGNGFGGWAMVALSLVSAASSTALAALASKWRPRFQWDRAYLRSIRPQAVALLARHALSAAVIPLLSVLVNIQLGAAAAGTMQIAFRILGLIDAIAVSPLRYLTLPLFAQAAREGRDVGAAITAALSVGSLLLFPAYVGVMATAPALLPVLLGSVTGEAVVGAVQALLPYGLFALVTWTLNNALVATGRAVSVARRNYVLYPFVVGPAALATYHSVPLTLLTYGVWGGLVAAGLAVLMARRYFAVSPGRLLAPVIGPLACAIVMGAVVWAARSRMPAADAPVGLLLQIALGVGVYAALLLVTCREQVTAALGLMLRRTRKGREVSIVYAYASQLPNTDANAGAVLGLCRALALKATPTTVIFPGSAEDVPAIREAYDLPSTVEMVPIRPGRGPAFYPSIAWAAARARRGAIVMTRAPQIALVTALAGRQALLDLHQPLDVFSNWRTWRGLLAFIPGGRLSVAASTPGLAAGLDPRLARKTVEIAVLPSSAPDLHGEATPTHDVGYVGSFRRGKGIEIVERLAQRRPALRFLVVGDPAGDPEAGRRLEGLPNVELAGFTPPAGLALQMGRFRIGLAPYAAEGFAGGRDAVIGSDSLSSLKIVEYLSAGRAVVASRLPAVEAMVTDEVEALLCPPDDDEAWLAALDRLMTDRDLGERLTAAGRRRFLTAFSMAARADRVRELARVRG